MDDSVTDSKRTRRARTIKHAAAAGVSLAILAAATLASTVSAGAAAAPPSYVYAHARPTATPCVWQCGNVNHR
jgi:hypothetical protein